jgi:predicted nucleic acid-binding Zn ribbon protein
VSPGGNTGRRRRPQGDDAGPQHVGQAVAKVLGRMGASPSPTTMALVFTRWEEVVGPELAAHLHPVRLQDAVLLIGVEHPAWGTRARMESRQILRHLRELGDTSVERIDVVVQRPS